jgi:predicted RNase H-like nuclease (RuvC/YqgF family)
VNQEVEKLQNDLSGLEKSVHDMEKTIRATRNELRSASSMATEAKIAKDKAIEEADELRTALETRVEDSGKIRAYEEAIEVYKWRDAVAHLIGGARAERQFLASGWCPGSRSNGCNRCPSRD